MDRPPFVAEMTSFRLFAEPDLPGPLGVLRKGDTVNRHATTGDREAEVASEGGGGMVGPQIRAHITEEVRRMGLEPVHMVHAMGKSEWPNGEYFYMDDNYLVATRSCLVVIEVQEKGRFSKKLVTGNTSTFQYAEMSSPGVSTEPPKSLRFRHDPQVVDFLDVFGDPEWDALVSFWRDALIGHSASSPALEEEVAVGVHWNRIRDYIVAKYNVETVSPTLLKLVFGFDDGRSQLLFVSAHTLMDGQEEWIQVNSPIGRVDALPLKALLVEAGEMVVGSLGAVGEIVDLRNTLPAEGLDLAYLDRVIRLVCVTADRLEEATSGGDTF